MANLTAREKALLRAAMETEFSRLDKDAQNTSSEYLSAYPRMMYRMTDVEETTVLTTHNDGRPREVRIDNQFAGLLCDTIIAETADEAEALTADGWDISPQAAHGVVTGMAAATTAKDDEIAALRAELAAERATKTGGKGSSKGPPETLALAE
ncbi:hypothetical protein [Sphingomonas sp. R86520]|uniref:hypothetical protein n=1 Tax=Sphingomonas sp. R86520 TaxID=3093859 RepID=UPI0036D27D36